ncbi:MAG TPA: hypothetical protein DCW33_00685 [Proteobacteria bacterium]|mgnify:CR=1 FL=1|nr:hypothetical protein [Pseudomonadota bacterium]
MGCFGMVGTALMLAVFETHLFDDHRFYIVRFIVSLRNVMAKNAISIIGFNASNYLVLNVLHTLMILLLGRVEYGHFFLAAQIISVFSPILLLGRDSLMVKKIPHLIHQTRKDWLMSFIRDNLRFLCISICIGIALILFFVFVQTYNLVTCRLFFCEQNSLLYANIALILPLSLPLYWNQKYLVATQQPFYANALSPNVFVGCFLYIFITVYLIAQQLTGIIPAVPHHGHIAMLYGVSSLVILALQCVIIHSTRSKLQGLTLFDCAKHSAPPPEVRSNYFHEGLHFLSLNVLFSALGLSITLIIEALHPGKFVLSGYFICAVVAGIASASGDYYSKLARPLYAKTVLSAAPEVYKPLESLISEYIWVGLLWLALCIMGFLLLQPMVFTLYKIEGADYVIGIISLMVFNYCTPIIFSPERFLTFSNIRYVLAANLVQLMTQILLTFYLVIDYGFLGAIFARISGSAVCALICWCCYRCSGSKVRIFGFF